MKLAFAGKGGVGKTTACAWLGDYLARQGKNVWMIDADTALSLGQASGLAGEDLPTPLVKREDLIRELIGSGLISMNPDVSHLPEQLAVDLPVSGPVEAAGGAGAKRLLVMGSVAAAGGGCACSANALLKALLAHLVTEVGDWVLVDLEAGVEHLGRGTVQSVDGLAVVSEPSRRSLQTAASVGGLAKELGLSRQVLVLNRAGGAERPPDIPGLPGDVLNLPVNAELAARQLETESVLELEDWSAVDSYCEELLDIFTKQVAGGPDRAG
jgi:CO dehydrogenase maturation factor